MSELADPQVLLGARRALERYGWRQTTLERVAEEAGISRMTLHRRGVSRASLLNALALDLERDYRDAIWPAMAATGTGRERLETALAAACEVAEGSLALIGALGDQAHNAMFREEGPRALTRDVYTAPLQRLLLDGMADGSLKRIDAAETATVLFNLVAFTYRHLRQGHGWPPEQARRAVVAVALDGVAT